MKIVQAEHLQQGGETEGGTSNRQMWTIGADISITEPPKTMVARITISQW